MVDVIAIEKYGITGLELMETAGCETAELVERKGIDGPVVICCGKGNNAGDGFVIARYLAARHHKVEVWVFSDSEQFPHDASVNYAKLRDSDCPIMTWEADAQNWETGAKNFEENFENAIGRADWVVDALLGTGAVGQPREPYAGVIRKINCLAKRILAVDVPSGLDVDRGEPTEPTIRANFTGTFVAMKRGFLNPNAAEWLGEIHVIDIGVPNGVIEEVLAIS